MDVKCFWVASMPRSGSMWAFNVARALFRAAGYRVLPEHVPRRASDMLAHTDQALANENANTIWILKTHNEAQRELPNCKFITTHRDLRDALVSFMNFVRCDFDQALQAMTAAARVSDCYRDLPDGRVLHLDYADISRIPGHIVRRIAEFCGTDTADETIAEIANRFDKANVGKLIAATETDIVTRLRKDAVVDDNEIVPLANGQTRVMHLATGFQGGHVTGYQDGDWRQILTAAQQREVHAAFADWLARNGYPV